MSAIIHSENFLAICLLLARGDVKKPLESVIKSVEHYQQLFNRHFGIGPYDFRGSLMMMLWLGMGLEYENIFTANDSHPQNVEVKLEILLADCIDYILNTREVSFNDEGEVFSDCMVTPPNPSCEYLNIREKAFNGIKSYFTNNNDRHPEDILAFLENYKDYDFTEHGNERYSIEELAAHKIAELSAALLIMEADQYGLVDFLKKHIRCFGLLFRCSRQGPSS